MSASLIILIPVMLLGIVGLFCFDCRADRPCFCPAIVCTKGFRYRYDTSKTEIASILSLSLIFKSARNTIMPMMDRADPTGHRCWQCGGYYEHVIDRFDSGHIARDRRYALLRRLHIAGRGTGIALPRIQRQNSPG